MVHILIADDDSNLRDALADLLVSCGYLVTTASNGIEALHAAVTHRPDVILSDVNMPFIEGPEVVRILRSAPDFRDIPVILMSGLVATSPIPVSAILQKPVPAALLLGLVEQICPRQVGQLTLTTGSL